MPSPRFLLVLAMGWGLTAACGGAVHGPPPPLGRHFQDSYIAARPLEEKNDIIKAQNEFHLAKMEMDKAQADLAEADRLLAIAKNDAGAARFSEASARTNMSAATASADQNRIAAATREKRAAELTLNAANERVAYYTAYQRWVAEHLRYTQENTYWRESQYELAKAQLAQRSNIAPAGFVPNDYVKQEAERNQRAAQQQRVAETYRGTASAARTRWRTIQHQADETLGIPSTFPDPMAEPPPITPPAPAAPTTFWRADLPDRAST